MQREGYRKLAKYYDIFYQSKDYERESRFIGELMNRVSARSVLDVGCGTGTHMHWLEELGYECTGLDLNAEMLEVARKKVKGDLYRSDMTSFSIGAKFDAVICMFAAFNHLIEYIDARNALGCFNRHLNPGGLILIDLHNPQSSGTKTDKVGGIERIMDWDFDPHTGIEKTSVKFVVSNRVIEDEHTMRIYNLDEMFYFLTAGGFGDISAFGNYSLESATPMSKNIEIVGYKIA